MRAAFLLPPSFMTQGRMGARKAAPILMKSSHFDTTVQYTEEENNLLKTLMRYNLKDTNKNKVIPKLDWFHNARKFIYPIKALFLEGSITTRHYGNDCITNISCRAFLFITQIVCVSAMTRHYKCLALCCDISYFPGEVAFGPSLYFSFPNYC